MNKIIVPTGYMGSGSSAITDVLAEIEGFHNANGSFEYVFMHCPDGVFDLEDKLLIGNNAIRSDEAINRFRHMMKCLYDEKNFWPGMYKKRISEEFLWFSDAFIEGITTAKINDSYWYFTENPDNIMMQLAHYIGRVMNIVSFNKIKVKTPVKYKEMSIAFPDALTFYEEAKKFLHQVFASLGVEDHNLVLDQLLLPHNLYRMDNYFDDNVKVIVVDRDPRDVFVLNKYRWVIAGGAVPYPLDVKEFVEFYGRMRKCEKYTDSKNVFRIHFEDLIYNYESVCTQLYAFLGVSASAHVDKKKYFNPDVSIKNTQLFLMNDQIEEECQFIQQRLKEYIYDFRIGKENSSLEELF